MSSKNISEKPIWIGGFLGVNQRQAMDSINDNASPLLINISCDKVGTWSKRKGVTKLGSTGSHPVKGLISFAKSDGTHVLCRITNGDLETFNGTSWVSAIASVANTSDDIAMVNYNGKLYFTGENTNLQYWDGASATTTTVGAGGNEIRGTMLSVAQFTLWLAGRPGYLNNVYYSLFNTTTNEPGDQFYESNPAETLATSTRYLKFPTPVVAMQGNDAINANVICTHNKSYKYQLEFADNALGPKTIYGMGVCSKKAMTICNDWSIFADQKVLIKAWGGAGKPAPLSWEIEDDSNKESIINQVNKSNLSNICTGSIGNKFWVSVGDVTFRGTSYINVVLKGLVTADMGTVVWGFDTYPFRITHFANAYYNGQEVLVAGSSNNNVYVMDLGTNDDGVAIDARAYTKFYDFGVPYKTKDIPKILIKFKPQPASETYLSIRYALDGKFSYTDLSTPDAVNPVTSHGTIDMGLNYEVNKEDDIAFVFMPTSTDNRSISFEFSNDQLDEGFEIQQFGIGVGGIRDIDIKIQ